MICLGLKNKNHSTHSSEARITRACNSWKQLLYWFWFPFLSRHFSPNSAPWTDSTAYGCTVVYPALFRGNLHLDVRKLPVRDLAHVYGACFILCIICNRGSNSPNSKDVHQRSLCAIREQRAPSYVGADAVEQFINSFRTSRTNWSIRPVLVLCIFRSSKVRSPKSQQGEIRGDRSKLNCESTLWHRHTIRITSHLERERELG